MCRYTLKCLSIGTPKIINLIFHLPQMENSWFLRVPIFKHIIMRLYSALVLGHLKIMNFPFGTNGKFIFHLEQMENLLFLGVPILNHIRVPTHWFTWWCNSVVFHMTAHETYANSVFGPRTTSTRTASLTAANNEVSLRV